jgi:hypothetical protein
MPGGDRTGPRGFGPMTGRKAGYCAGHDTPGFDNPYHRYGMRYGGRFGSWAGGRGWRHWYHATGLPGWARGGYETPDQESELAKLKDESEWLSKRIDATNKRIDELEQKD